MIGIWTRRGMLGLLAGAAGGVAGLLAVVQAAPGERKRKRQRRRQRRRRKAPGPPLFPDLRTLPPSDLHFDEVDEQHVLRFTNTVWNAGEGRLELQAPTSPAGSDNGQLYQNLYDAPTNGKLAQRLPVDGRIVYHPTHQHYHLADFAAYRLLRRNPAGEYQEVGHGIKTSFCIINTVRISGPFDGPRPYDRCEQQRQGLTPGWADIYASILPEQWVELPEWPMLPGDYALLSIADPKNLLAEGGGEREANNAATTYFTVDENGDIVNERETP